MQGQWGGSILDSVVGVFLTQNVSDALSSKAFMNLAATFPLPEGDRKEGIESMDWEAVHTAPVEKVGCLSTIITPLFEDIAVAELVLGNRALPITAFNSIPPSGHFYAGCNRSMAAELAVLPH